MNDPIPLPENLRQDDFEAMTDDADPEVSPKATDYKTVLELMNQYLAMARFAGKTVTTKMLRELGLLENSPSGNLLNNCWPGLD